MKEKKKIVVCDDNKELREVIADYILLQRPDMFEISALAKDGEQAIEAVEKHEPDILILDILMPGIDGLAVLQKLKRKNLKKFPKIFVLSSVGYDSAVQRIIKEGIDYYMIKPFIYELFLDALICVANGQAAIINHTEIKEEKSEIEIEYTLETKITKLLNELGVPDHIKGYKYLNEALIEIYYDNELINALTTKLYPKIADKCLTSVTSVERTIRVAIEVTCNKNNIETGNIFKRFLHNRKKPTNYEFIFAVFEKLKKELE